MRVKALVSESTQWQMISWPTSRLVLAAFRAASGTFASASRKALRPALVLVDQLRAVGLDERQGGLLRREWGDPLTEIARPLASLSFYNSGDVSEPTRWSPTGAWFGRGAPMGTPTSQPALGETDLEGGELAVALTWTPVEARRLSTYLVGMGWHDVRTEKIALADLAGAATRSTL